MLSEFFLLPLYPEIRIDFPFYTWGLYFCSYLLEYWHVVLWSWYSDNAVPGWSSLMVSVWFCTGCLLIALGIVGEYVGKVYKEVKNRPRYNIDEYVGIDE